MWNEHIKIIINYTVIQKIKFLYIYMYNYPPTSKLSQAPFRKTI